MLEENLAELRRVLRNVSVPDLARYTDGLMAPDPGSEGARFLQRVCDHVEENVQALLNDNEYDSYSEMVETIVPVMTEGIWRIFVDLEAFRTAHADEASGLTEAHAQGVLHEVAADLARGLWEEYLSEPFVAHVSDPGALPGVVSGPFGTAHAAWACLADDLDGEEVSLATDPPTESETLKILRMLARAEHAVLGVDHDGVGSVVHPGTGEVFTVSIRAD